MVHVPNEIWEHIFSYLECSMPIDGWWLYGSQYNISSLKDLASLSLVCRTFRPIAQKFMYRTLLADTFDNDGSCKMLLARSLAERPNLGDYTKELCFTALEPGYPHTIELESVLEDERVPERSKRWLKMSMVESRFLTQLYSFMGNLQVVDCSVYIDASYVAGMLSGRRDVERFVQADTEVKENLGYRGIGVKHEEHGILPATLSNETLSDNALPQLKEVRIRHGDCEQDTLSISDIEAIFLHPGLERLYLLGFDWGPLGLSRARWPLYPSETLQVLHLRECLVDASTLQNIFARFNNLHTLHMTLGEPNRIQGTFNQDYEYDEEWIINLKEVGDVLRQHGQNIVSLELRFMNLDGQWTPEGTLGSLKEMSSLRHLKVCKCDLAGYQFDGPPRPEDPLPLPLHQVLPRALETWYLFGEHTCHVDHSDKSLLDSLTELVKSDEAPNLREIKVETFRSARDCKFDIENWKAETIEVLRTDRFNQSQTTCFLIELTRAEDRI